jgi:hypothetical protein
MPQQGQNQAFMITLGKLRHQMMVMWGLQCQERESEVSICLAQVTVRMRVMMNQGLTMEMLVLQMQTEGGCYYEHLFN